MTRRKSRRGPPLPASSPGQRHAAGLLLSFVLAATGASAQTVRVDRPTDAIVDVSGGAEAAPWRLRYGTAPAIAPPLVLAISGDRAWLVHGPWLRHLDIAGGRVLGRWRFPNVIRQVVPSKFGSTLTVRFEREPGAAETTLQSVLFDPTYGDVPPWNLSTPAPYTVSETEAWALLKNLSPSLESWRTPLGRPGEAIPVLEDLNRRDPTSPWLRFALGKALADAGDARAAAVFAEAAAMESTDFTELFRIAGTLELLDPPRLDAATIAYERGYTDFVRHFHDARLMTSLASLLALYPPVPTGQPLSAGLSEAAVRQRLEHVYRLAPAGEGGERAWQRVAEYWEAKGDDAAARAWRDRAAAAGRRSLFLATPGVQRMFDRLMILTLAALLAGAIVVAALARRHSMNLARASGRDRAALLLIAAAAWLSIGLAGVYLRVIERARAEPLHLGEIGGPDDIALFAGRQPESPERDLLAAIAYQMTGDLTESERRYRRLPQFAVSWNNLGVVLARTRRPDEARKAFARALELAPDLPEGQLNTDKLPPTLETELHQKYAPIRKMMALPDREVVLRAYMGREWAWWYRAMAAGPVRDLRHFRGRPGSGESIGAGALRLGVLLLALVASAIALVAPFQARGSASAPLPRPLERLVPGLAPWWGWAGGLALLLWCVLLSAIALSIAKGVGYAPTALAEPDLVATFGLLPGAPAGPDLATPSLLTMSSLFGLLTAATWVISGRERI